jgi:hypothetical protein
MIRVTIGCFAVGVALLAAGCGGSSSSPGGTGSSSGFTTTVPSSQQLGSLSDADEQKLCMELDTYLNSSNFTGSIIEFSCRTTGLLAATLSPDQTTSGLQSSCKMAYDECLNGDAGSATTSPPDTSAMCASKPTSACMATVGQLQACLNDTFNVLKSSTNSVPACSSLTPSTLESALKALPSDENTTEPASCNTVEKECPEFMGMIGSM